MKNKIYIAGPMRGLECYNFEAFFVMASRMKRAGFEVVNPAQVDTEKMFDGWQYTSEQYQDVLFHDIQIIKDEIKCIVLLDGWESSHGAKAEKAFGEAVGVGIAFQKDIDQISVDCPFEPEFEIIRGVIHAAMKVTR